MNILELAKRNQQKAWEIIEDTRIVRNHNRIVHFALSAILHTQEPEENLNILLLFQLFSNSNQLFVPFFTELTD